MTDVPVSSVRVSPGKNNVSPGNKHNIQITMKTNENAEAGLRRLLELMIILAVVIITLILVLGVITL